MTTHRDYIIVTNSNLSVNTCNIKALTWYNPLTHYTYQEHFISIQQETVPNNFCVMSEILSLSFVVSLCDYPFKNIVKENTGSWDVNN